MRSRERSRDIGISAISYALPPVTATLDQLARRRKITSSKETLRDFGFRRAHLAGRTSAYHLALEAAGRLLASAHAGAESIGQLIYASALSTPTPQKTDDPLALFDYPATRLQYELGLTRCRVLGVSQAGCVALFAAIRVARDALLAEPELDRVLCVGSDVLPRASRREILYNLISDGACAALIEKSQRNRILSYAQTTKGFYNRAKGHEHQLIATYFSTARSVIDEALERARLTMDDIDLIIPHNVSRKSWDILLDLLGAKRSKLFTSNIASKGHTIAADPLINLHDAVARKKVRPGDRLLLFTFGFGAHWACMVLEH